MAKIAIKYGSSDICSIHQLPEDLFRKCTCLPPQPPTRTRSARPLFFVFSFTSSPYDYKKLGNSDLWVKVSPLFPSPVKAKKGYFLHVQNTLYQRLAGKGEKGEGRNCELAECAMRKGVSVRAYGGVDEKQWVVWWAKERASFQKKRGGRREKKGRFVRKSTSFYSISPCP